MIEKIKNLMNNGFTDLVSYDKKDDYSKFWKDLKPLEYEHISDILRKYVNNFYDNSSLNSKFKISVERDSVPNVSHPYRVYRMFFSVTDNDRMLYCKTVIKITQNIETLFPITIENELNHGKENNTPIVCNSTEEAKKELDSIIYSDYFKKLIINVATYYKYL